MTKKIDRRIFLSGTSTLAALGLGNVLGPRIAFSETDAPLPSRKRFLLNIHFGSGCGFANGLVQPVKVGEWPKGSFIRGSTDFAVNPLLNTHTREGSLIFTDYNKFLAEIADHMCNLTGNPVSLAHDVARRLQTMGSQVPGLSPNWTAGVSQNMIMPGYPNPFVLNMGEKTNSVKGVTPLDAQNYNAFKTITRDSNLVPRGDFEGIWSILKSRFQTGAVGSTELPDGLGSNSNLQLDTLVNGIAELNELESNGQYQQLQSRLQTNEVAKIIEPCLDKQGIRGQFKNSIRDNLILAGMLAKGGLASGMSFTAMGEDRHGGGADVITARLASAVWAQVLVFWQWVKEQGLAEDVTILVTQEFARSPYNDNTMDIGIVGPNGAQTVKTYGRDHGLFMGMMFINANVPKASRVGSIGENLVPLPAADLTGKSISGSSGHVSTDMVGSMLMRLYPELFPTERIVRKHWPTFKEIDPLLA